MAAEPSRRWARVLRRHRVARLLVAGSALALTIPSAAVASTCAPAEPSRTSTIATPPPTPYFEEVTGSQVSVHGNYRPVIGSFTTAGLDDIFWYAADGTDRLWTPCPGCEAGPFTK